MLLTLILGTKVSQLFFSRNRQVAPFFEYDDQHPGSTFFSVEDSQKTVSSYRCDKLKFQVTQFNPNQLHLHAV
jgi:hypothetical protein